MKLGVFSDVHIHNFQQFGKPSQVFQGINTRAEDCFNAIIKAYQTAKENDAEALLFCGDLFENRGTLSVSLIRIAQVVLQHICSDIPVYAISGNHDYASKHGESVSSVELFDTIENLKVISLGTEYLNGVAISGVSHGKSYEDLEKHTADSGVLLLHTTFSGTTISDSHIAETGEDLDDLKEYMKDNNYSMCFVGDIHRRQNLGDGVWYVGSLLQNGFGDEQDKGMLIVDTETKSVRFHTIVSPRFVTIQCGEDVEESGYYRIATESETDYSYAKQKYGDFTNSIILPPNKTVTKKRVEGVTLNSDPMKGLSAWMTAKGIEVPLQKELKKLAKPLLK